MFLSPKNESEFRFMNLRYVGPRARSGLESQNSQYIVYQTILGLSQILEVDPPPPSIAANIAAAFNIDVRALKKMS